MAILLQSLCVRLGVATGKDLAQACREYFSSRVSFILWVLCEIAIAACDLAELLGSAIVDTRRVTIVVVVIAPMSFLMILLNLAALRSTKSLNNIPRRLELFLQPEEKDLERLTRNHYSSGRPLPLLPLSEVE